MGDRYMQPFWDLDHEGFPSSVDAPMSLSGATRLFVTVWDGLEPLRYAIQSYHSDHWWDDEFFQQTADELEERVAMTPDVIFSWQFLPLGRNTQWARNGDLNSLTWRDTRPYVDDWMMMKNESRYDEVTTRMRNFRERTRHFWQHSDGSDR